MQSLACLNGELMPVEEAKVPVWDRGFLFGDSIYEVCRLYQGRSWLEDSHLARLRWSLQQMRFPQIDLEDLRLRMSRTVAASEIHEGTIYIQITRGVAPRKHTFPSPDVPLTEVIIVRPYDDTETARHRETGVGIVSHPDWRWKRCDVKSTNLLANVLACQVAHEAGCMEAVLFDEEGLVTEATHSSLMWIQNGVIGGTPDGPEILPGTSRHYLLELAEREGLRFEPGRVRLDALADCDELMLTGTTIEVMPVVRVDERIVGNGSPGPITLRLQRAFRQAVRDWLEPSSAMASQA